MLRNGLFIFAIIAMVNSASSANYDVLIRHGMIYDGSGKPGVAGAIVSRTKPISTGVETLA